MTAPDEPTEAELREGRAAAHALGALDADERAAFEAELARDPAAAALVADLERAAGGLSLALAPLAPSPGLRAAILARVGASDPTSAPAESPSPPTTGRSPATPKPVAVDPDDADERVIAATTRALAGLCVGLAVAVLGLLMAFASANEARRRAESGLSAEVQARVLLEADVRELTARLERERRATSEAQADGARAARLDEAERLLRDRDTRLFGLGPHGPSPAIAGGTVLLSSTGREAFLVADNLPPLPEGRAWQLWTIERERAGPQPAGTFGERGATCVIDLGPLEVRPEHVQRFALSIEPPGGSRAPTGDIVLIGP